MLDPTERTRRVLNTTIMTVTREQLVADIISLVVEQNAGEIERESLSADSELSGDCNLDSLDVVDIVLSLEQMYKFRMPDGDSDEAMTQTIGSFAAVISDSFRSRARDETPAGRDGGSIVEPDDSVSE